MGEIQALGHEAYLVRVPPHAPAVLPAFAVEFALDCLKFLPLERHLASYARKHALDALQVEALAGALPALTSAGMLVGTAALREAWHEENGAGSPRISALGMVTGGTRQALVERSLRSFLENAATYQRKLQWLVADSSTRLSDETATRSLLARLAKEFHQPLFFAGVSEKQTLIAQLSAAGACSPETGEFALLDPLHTGFVCGGNRNVLLLQAAGTMFGSLDDDVVCRLSQPMEEALADGACFSDRDPYARWLYPDRASALAEARWVEQDYAGLHETMLGRTPGGVFSQVDSIDFAQAGDGLVRRLHDGPTRVRATFTGHVGDPGIPSSTYYLSYDGDNRERICASEAHYRGVFPSRSVACLAPGPMLGDASLSPGMAMALDHRELLPPFFPVLHAEDFSYGAALWQCCPGALLGHLPYAVWHDPLPGKAILTPREVQPGRRAAFFRICASFAAAPLRASSRAAGLGCGTDALARALPRGDWCAGAWRFSRCADR